MKRAFIGVLVVLGAVFLTSLAYAGEEKTRVLPTSWHFSDKRSFQGTYGKGDWNSVLGGEICNGGVCQTPYPFTTDGPFWPLADVTVEYPEPVDEIFWQVDDGFRAHPRKQTLFLWNYTKNGFDEVAQVATNGFEVHTRWVEVKPEHRSGNKIRLKLYCVLNFASPGGVSLQNLQNYAGRTQALHAYKKTSELVAVHRWFHKGDKDWISLADGEIPDAKLKSWGYIDKKFQFYAFKSKPNNGVAVYRWFHKGDKDWISLAEDEIPDAKLKSWGYTDKKFQFYASKSKPNNGVAVHRWFYKGDKDWISLADGEIPDAKLKSWGYTDKKFQFYAIQK
jgi:hypothetical protein